ncbi:MAG: hypothetical protein ACKOZT_03815 [Cyanobium sp.]
MARPPAAPFLPGSLGALFPRRGSGKPDLEQELELARRLGHWYTEEDRQLVREHEVRLATERQEALVRKVGRGGAIALIVVSTALPLLWPLAILAGVKAFPSTSRRLGVALAIGAGVSLITAGVVVVQLGRALLAPEPVPALSSGDTPATPDLGSDVAARLERATDYWSLEGTSADGTATWRKGLYQLRDGRPLMVLPRSSWLLLSATERRALAAHARRERGVQAVYVGRVVPASGFQGNTITVEEQVWP